jgi:hypothetical protein
MASGVQYLDASLPLLGARVLVAEDDALVSLDQMTTLQTASYVSSPLRSEDSLVIATIALTRKHVMALHWAWTV